MSNEITQIHLNRETVSQKWISPILIFKEKTETIVQTYRKSNSLIIWGDRSHNEKEVNQPKKKKDKSNLACLNKLILNFILWLNLRILTFSILRKLTYI